MGLVKIVEQILASRQDLTRQDVITLIERKQAGAKAFFTTEAAARIVAAELGVPVESPSLRFEVLIQDLVSGLNDVTLTGRVVTRHPPKKYTRRNGTEGRFIRLLFSDRSGALPVLVWDDKVATLENVKPGQSVRISHGYVREGLNGKVELHVGRRGRIALVHQENDK